MPNLKVWIQLTGQAWEQFYKNVWVVFEKDALYIQIIFIVFVETNKIGIILLSIPLSLIGKNIAGELILLIWRFPAFFYISLKMEV